MAYVPGFRYDVFISYSSRDNVDGWVERFEQLLTGELTRLLGRPFSDKTVFLDKRRLAVGQHYPVELDESAQASALLVPLLSPNYLTSDWCNRERHAFFSRLPEGASIPQSVAAVCIRPVQALPSVFDKAQQLSFVIDGVEEPWPADSIKWTELVKKLAVQIKPLLEALRKRTGAVFVGTPLASHMDLRANLASELADLHFRATPDAVAMLDDRAFRQKALAEAACAVHFIGGASDDALEAVEESVRICPGRTILFTPFGAHLTAQEEELLAGLDPYPHRTGPNVVELQKFLADLLTQVRQAAEPARPASLGVVCEPADFARAAEIAAPGLSVDHPRFLHEKLTNMDRIKRWKRFVRDSHGLLFYEGESEEERLDRIRRLADEEKVDAPRRWYLAEPDLDAKRARHPKDPVFPDGLDEFLEEVRRRSQGSGGGG